MFVTMLLFAVQAPSVTPATATAAPEPEQRVCRREIETGSVFTRKVCHSKAEWARIDSARDDRMTRNPGGPQGCRREGC